MVAVRVEGVDVEPRLRGGQQGAHLSGKDVVPQPLRGTHVLLVAGEGDGVAGGCRGLRGTVEGGNAGHGTLLVTGRFGGAAADRVGAVRALLFFRCRLACT